MVEQVGGVEWLYQIATAIDIVLQIRRYATILAATREKQAKGDKTDAMDYTP